MNIWIAGIVVLFGMTELWQWVQQAALPFPILLVGGALLAIASNYEKLVDRPFEFDSAFDSLPETAPNAASGTATNERSPSKIAAAESAKIAPGTLKQEPSHQTASEASISFEIRKPFQPGD